MTIKNVNKENSDRINSARWFSKENIFNIKDSVVIEFNNSYFDL